MSVRLTELNPFSLKMTKELDSFLEYDAMNWKVKFLWYGAKSWTFCSNMTKRIGPFFSNITPRNELFSKYDSQNWFFFWIWPTELNFSYYYWKNWTPFSDKTRRIELFFVEYDSTDWTLFKLTQRIEIFLNVIHRVFSRKWL